MNTEKEDAKILVAENVRGYMVRHGWSLRELARRSHNSPMRLSRLLRHQHMPQSDALQRIARALGVSLDDLFRCL